jgi:hypothetical protein
LEQFGQDSVFVAYVGPHETVAGDDALGEVFGADEGEPAADFTGRGFRWRTAVRDAGEPDAVIA